jgi:hypothetical protein
MLNVYLSRRDVYSKDIYSNATTTVRTSQSEETNPVNINAGVKQSCPVSPILFNLTSELLIQSIVSKCNENSNIYLSFMANLFPS